MMVIIKCALISWLDVGFSDNDNLQVRRSVVTIYVEGDFVLIYWLLNSKDVVTFR